MAKPGFPKFALFVQNKLLDAEHIGSRRPKWTLIAGPLRDALLQELGDGGEGITIGLRGIVVEPTGMSWAIMANC